ncbi:MAG: hypothetical protein JNK74_14010 [Candidatus Hydrogenedentes bacterium]|nr:hypothetical protein [Candidatus Hydrogenedentota bacterium]
MLKVVGQADAVPVGARHVRMLGQSERQDDVNPILKTATIVVALLLLSLITGFSQIKTEGLAWQEANYWPRLEAVANGTAPAPDQYRVLTDRLVVVAVNSAGALGVPRPVGLTFVALRLFQNLLLFVLAFVFYRKLGIHPYPAVLGLSALAWGMTQANYGADLGFNASTDVLLYLGAALALVGGRPAWLIPITVIAALNRESSILIPYMALAIAVRWKPRLTLDKTIAGPAFAALAVWCVLFVVLHVVLGARPWALHESGAAPGFGLLRYNLTNPAAWEHAFGMVGILPVLALLSWRYWATPLKAIFWSVAPLWCVGTLFCAPVDQSRVLLLPQVLVFVPGLLCGLAGWREVHENKTPGLLA